MHIIVGMNSATTWTERAVAAVKAEIEYRMEAAEAWDPHAGPWAGDHKIRSTWNARHERRMRNRWENVLTKLRMREARLRMR